MDHYKDNILFQVNTSNFHWEFCVKSLHNTLKQVFFRWIANFYSRLIFREYPFQLVAYRLENNSGIHQINEVHKKVLISLANPAASGRL